jgi:DNA-binding Lrp family transcriptional regulator
MVMCELDGHIVSTHCEHHVVIGNLILGMGIAQQVDEALGNVKTTNGDIGILFDGQLSLSGVWVSGRLRELLKGGCVKAIGAGYHFEEEAMVELVCQIESTMSYSWLKMILRNAYQYVEELSLTRFAIHVFFAPHLANEIGSLEKLEYLTLCDLRCPEISFTHLVRGLVSNTNNLRYLDVAKNSISRLAAYKLKDVLCSHSKLVFLNMGFCEMDLGSLDLILDGCEMTRQMQSLEAGSTIASSTEGMNKIESRLSSGRLCLLNIGFHDGDNTSEFIQRIRPYMARNYAERKSIELIKNNELNYLDLPEALQPIVCSLDGIENTYKLLIGDYNQLLNLFKSR